MIYFLDTNICIYHLNDSSPKLSELLEQTPSVDIKITSMAAAELIYGAEKSAKREYNLEKVKAFLSLYKIVPFDGKAAEIHGEIRAELERKGMIIGGNDLVIAATVLASGGTLITHNVGEFSRIAGLNVSDWT